MSVHVETDSLPDTKRWPPLLKGNDANLGQRSWGYTLYRCLLGLCCGHAHKDEDRDTSVISPAYEPMVYGDVGHIFPMTTCVEKKGITEWTLGNNVLVAFQL